MINETLTFVTMISQRVAFHLTSIHDPFLTPLFSRSRSVSKRIAHYTVLFRISQKHHARNLTCHLYEWVASLSRFSPENDLCISRKKKKNEFVTRARLFGRIQEVRKNFACDMVAREPISSRIFNSARVALIFQIPRLECASSSCFFLFFFENIKDLFFTIINCAYLLCISPVLFFIGLLVGIMIFTIQIVNKIFEKLILSM